MRQLAAPQAPALLPSGYKARARALHTCSGARWPRAAAGGGVRRPHPEAPRRWGDLENHSAFPIQAGTAHALGSAAAMSCQSCHPPSADSFKQFTCVGCHGHEQAVTDLAPRLPAGLRLRQRQLPGLPSGGEEGAILPRRVSGRCALCHDTGTPFAALPLAGFTHPVMGSSDCGGCPQGGELEGGDDGAQRRPGPRAGPHPHRAGAQLQRAGDLPPLRAGAGAPHADEPRHARAAGDHLATCTQCHLEAGSGVYFPGSLHSALANSKAPPPATCESCHAATEPLGFVGPTATTPARTPSSGEMKHGAVKWAGGVPTAAPAYVADCATCHSSPSAALEATWGTGRAPATVAEFHPALTRAGKPQPDSCIDCHANSRPTALLTSANAALPANVSLNHSAPATLDDCAGCHAAAQHGTAWTGAALPPRRQRQPEHLPALPRAGSGPPAPQPGPAAPTTRSPFDYVTNAAASPTARARTARSATAGTQNWARRAIHPRSGDALGRRLHHLPRLAAAGSPAGDQRRRHGHAARLRSLGERHRRLLRLPPGDRHRQHLRELTTTRHRRCPAGTGRAARATRAPRSRAACDRFVTVTRALAHQGGRAARRRLVTGDLLVRHALQRACSTPRPRCPRQLSAGAGRTAPTTPAAGTATRTPTAPSPPTPTAPTTPRSPPTPPRPAARWRRSPQPTSQCADCHAQMRPPGHRRRRGHRAAADGSRRRLRRPGDDRRRPGQQRRRRLECAPLPQEPGRQLGRRASSTRNIGAAVPRDCWACHYPLMADAAKSDLDQRHPLRHAPPLRAAHLPELPGAATRARSPSPRRPPAAALWSPGAYHASLAAQPAACLDCHALSDPRPPPRRAPSSTRSAGARTAHQPAAVDEPPLRLRGGEGVRRLPRRRTPRARAAPGAAPPPSTSPASRRWPPATTATASPTAAAPPPAPTTTCPPGSPASPTVTTAGDGHLGVPAGTLRQVSHADVNVAGARVQRLPHRRWRLHGGRRAGQGVGAGEVPRGVQCREPAGDERHQRALQHLPPRA